MRIVLELEIVSLMVFWLAFLLHVKGEPRDKREKSLSLKVALFGLVPAVVAFAAISLRPKLENNTTFYFVGILFPLLGFIPILSHFLREILLTLDYSLWRRRFKDYPEPRIPTQNEIKKDQAGTQW